jgi:hypothetical protein
LNIADRQHRRRKENTFISHLPRTSGYMVPEVIRRDQNGRRPQEMKTLSVPEAGWASEKMPRIARPPRATSPRFRVRRLLCVPIAAMEAKFAKVTKQWLESELADAPAKGG